MRPMVNNISISKAYTTSMVPSSASVSSYLLYVFHRSKSFIMGLGPNEISVSDAEAVPHILGLGGMRKGPREWQACLDVRLY